MMVARERPAGGARAHWRRRKGLWVPSGPRALFAASLPSRERQALRQVLAGRSRRRSLWMSLSPSSPATIQLTSASTPAPDWFSDGSQGGTGTTAAALQDGDGTPTGSKWNGQSSSDPLLSVVTAASTGFTWPTGLTNVFKVDGTTTSGTEARKVVVDSDTNTKWPNTAVGSYMYIREYFCSALPDSCPTTGNPHYSENHVGVVTFEWKQYQPNVNQAPACTVGSGQYSATVEMQTTTQGTYKEYMFTSPFATNSVYRIERRLYRKTTTTFNLAVRVYLVNSGSIFVDSSSTYNQIPGNGNTLAADTGNGLADFAVDTVTDSGTYPHTWQSWDFGQPGESAATNYIGNFVYGGAFAVWANRTDPNLWGALGSAALIYRAGIG